MGVLIVTRYPRRIDTLLDLTCSLTATTFVSISQEKQKLNPPKFSSRFGGLGGMEGIFDTFFLICHTDLSDHPSIALPSLIGPPSRANHIVNAYYIINPKATRFSQK